MLFLTIPGIGLIDNWYLRYTQAKISSSIDNYQNYL